MTALATPSAQRHIEHEGDKWILYDSTGNKKLGTHDSKEDAEKQEAAIKAEEGAEKKSKEDHTGVPDAEKSQKDDDDERLKAENEEDDHDIMDDSVVGKGGKPHNERQGHYHVCSSCRGNQRRRVNLRQNAVGVKNVRFKRDGSDAEETKGVLCGYAAVYYDDADTDGTSYVLYDSKYERLVEQIAPGAFDAAIRSCDVGAYFNHDRNLVLGRNTAGTLRLSVDKIGLSYEIDVPPTSYGRDLMISCERGDVAGASFHFEPLVETYTEERNADGKWYCTRLLQSVALHDISIVCDPAYTASSAKVRSLGELEEDVRRRLELARNEKFQREAEVLRMRIRLAELSA